MHIGDAYVSDIMYSQLFVLCNVSAYNVGKNTVFFFEMDIGDVYVSDIMYSRLFVLRNFPPNLLRIGFRMIARSSRLL
jgi:hypothetical protein